MSCSSANRSTSPPGRVYDSSHQRGEAGSWCNTAVSLLTARNWYPTSIFQWKSVRVNALARPPCDLAFFCGVFDLFAVVFCWPKICSPCWLRLLFRVANGPYGHPRVLPAHCLPLPIGAPTGPALDSPSVGVFCDGARTRLLRGGYSAACSYPGRYCSPPVWLIVVCCHNMLTARLRCFDCLLYSYSLPSGIVQQSGNAHK